MVKLGNCITNLFQIFNINNSINLNEKNVIELGGGNLKLYSLLKEHINSYTVIDNSSYGDSNDDPKLAFKKTLFNNYKEKNKYDIILHSHTFEHFYNPIREMKKLNKLLKIDGKLLASIPNVGKVIEDGYGNGVNFEHTFVVTKNNVEKFFTQSGFKILEIVDYNKYNFFVYATKTRNCSSEILDKISYENQKDMFLAFATKTKNFVMKIKEETEKEKEKYFFGCHIFTQYLLSFNKKIQNDFVGILDNDLSKVGQKLYGTELITYHPDKIKNDTKPCVVLAAGVYNNEIKKQLASINQNIKLVMM